jgi:hypothetical protein
MATSRHEPAEATAVETTAQRHARQAEETAQERGGTPVPLNLAVPANVFVHAVHPDHGEQVVFTPGELLPEWALDPANRQPCCQGDVARLLGGVHEEPAASGAARRRKAGDPW